MTTLTDLVQVLVDLERDRNAHLARIEARIAALEPAPDFLTIPQFAERAQCHPSTVKRAIANDLIRTVKLGDNTEVIPATECLGEFASERRRRQLTSVRKATAA
jgi:hypothetical protein